MNIDGQHCDLEILHNVGLEEYAALSTQHIRKGDGFLLVYSMADRPSFTHISRYYTEVILVKEFTQPRPTQLPGSPISPTVPVTRSLPILLVAYESEKAIKREVSTIEGQELAQQLNCEYAETSAKDRVNAEKAFYDVVRLLRIQQLEQRREESVARRKAWEARNTL